jgi:8-oxo-dGTP pyrophosphatase MutT (NUDIX family)
MRSALDLFRLVAILMSDWRSHEIKTMNLRLVARVITYNAQSKKVLLVKNRNQNYWYPPGGGWEYDKETIIECAEREVYEETGLKVTVIRLLYVQEFHPTQDSLNLETIWLAEPIEGTKLNSSHIDHDVNSQIETAQWFSQEELQTVRVFPKRLQNTFWENISKSSEDEDPFIRVS